MHALSITRILLLAALTLTAPARAAGPAFGNPLDNIINPHFPVFGQTQSQWADAWWQWAYPFGHESGPIVDLTGEHCGDRQSGAVWFLAGTYETRPVQRACKIPAGQHIFFPVINFVTVAVDKTGQFTGYQHALQGVHGLMTRVRAPVVEVDGVQIPNMNNYRQESATLFDLAHTVGGKNAVPAVASGYWVMLRPLPAGRHTVRFGAELSGFRQDIRYDLEIVPGGEGL